MTENETMGIKCKTSAYEISDYLGQKMEALRKASFKTLQYVGEQAIKEARENGKYKDRTGNLRSSIGYCILDNGKVIAESSFKVEKGTYTDERGNKHPYSGDQGAREGREFLNSLISEHSSGLVLIIVAGMQYAAYVEAKNLNVLDSAEQLTERLLSQLLKSIKFESNRI